MIRTCLITLLLFAPGVAFAQDVTAVLEPARSVELRSTVNGRVTRVTELEGTRVSKGDVVAEIDASVQRARVALAEVSARASGSVVRAEKLLEQAEFRRDRLVEARAKGAAQSWEVDMAEQAVAVARADLTVARDEQTRREAELALEEATLNEFSIVAPFDATVLNVSVDPGEIVDTATVIIEVGALDTLLATAFVPVEWAPALTVAKSVAASFGDGQSAEAVMRAVDPRVDPASQTIRVIVQVDNADKSLRPGEILTLHDPR